uniref:Uncharacterized protein n=1 Tax=Ascaris lumbricoides TaxID=6252 RepID=A0A0M3IIK8_ASCLU
MRETTDEARTRSRPFLTPQVRDICANFPQQHISNQAERSLAGQKRNSHHRNHRSQLSLPSYIQSRI